MLSAMFMRQVWSCSCHSDLCDCGNVHAWVMLMHETHPSCGLWSYIIDAWCIFNMMHLYIGVVELY